MKKFRGIVTSKGIALGKCVVISKDIVSIKPTVITDVKGEVNKFLLSKEKSIGQLERLFQNAISKISERDSMIFKSHQMMIMDNDFINKIIYYIEFFKYSADYAIFKASQDYIGLLSNLKSEYISQRADDVKDIMIRLIRNLPSGNGEYLNQLDIGEQCILAVEELMPSEILSIDNTKILGIIMKNGGKTSHTSILAKHMKIPTIVGSNFDIKQFNGKMIILDGIFGEVIIDPDELTVKEYLNKISNLNEDEKQLKSIVNLSNVTLDNREVKLMANVASADDVNEAVTNGADGIGLFRSEFLYMNRNNLPSEEELFNEYKMALINAGKKEVVIRTIDIGSDKNVECIKLPKETNPALGLRALRLCFDHLDIFKTQLRALIRASRYGSLCLLLPMVVSVKEVIKVKDIINEIKESLHRDYIPFNVNIPLGVMIETPSAVVISDLLAKQVDFFSIGTNDLVQYALVCDRDNISLSEVYHSNYISILRMIKTVVDNAHNNNIWVEVCGEVVEDKTIVDSLIGLGVDRVSIDTQNLLYIKKRLLNINYEKTKQHILNKLYP